MYTYIRAQMLKHTHIYIYIYIYELTTLKRTHICNSHICFTDTFMGINPAQKKISDWSETYLI